MKQPGVRCHSKYNADYVNLHSSPKNLKPGLKCDVFITHGWAEGIFEFVDQVETF